MKLFLRFIILSVPCLLFALRISAQGNSNFCVEYTKETLDLLTPLPLQFAPVPTAKASYWKTSIPLSMRNSYIQYGKLYKGKTWDLIPKEYFAEYKKNGNRVKYEKLYFAQRKQMGNLVIAEIMEHNDRFIPDIVNGLHYFINETWWGLPAHYPTNYPETNMQVVDIFNAETANLLAWTIYMLHDELENYEHHICKIIQHEIRRRFLSPAKTQKYTWKNSSNNWNTWICSNWLSCVLFCEDNRDSQLEAIQQIIQCLDNFFKKYPEDGGCDEGISYWDRAGAALIESLIILKLATQRQPTIDNTKKLNAIGSYIYKMYIGNKKFANFADASQVAGIFPNICFPIGNYLGDNRLMSYAKYVADYYQYEKNAGKLFNASGNYPFLSRELLFLSEYDSFKKVSPSEPIILYSCLPNIEVFAAHSFEGTKDGLYVAAKGGHNDESHNHNDVGNFIIYKDAEPLIIDIGIGTYTAQTFSNRRYELFNCRSAYHNVPIINGTEQHEGKEYGATSLKYKNNDKMASLTLDLSSAYPQKACVTKWKRTIRLNRGKEVLITEDYRISKYQKPTEIVLICYGDTKTEGTSDIVVNNGKSKGTLHFNCDQLSPSIEKIKFQDNTISDAWQNKDLYRIKLTIRSTALKGKITYSIK